MPAIPVQIFQPVDIKNAGVFLRCAVTNGEVAAAFVYGGELSESGDAWGHLYVFMPSKIGLTLPGHESIKKKFVISEFKQKEQIVLWIKDTAIDEALQTVNCALATA